MFVMNWNLLLLFVIAVVVVAIVAADIVASASCIEEFAVDYFLTLWDLVRFAGTMATFQPLDSNSFDRHTVANRELGIFVDLLIEELAAERRRTILTTSYCSSDIGIRNKKVVVLYDAGGSVVSYDTFDRIPISSFLRGYQLIVLDYMKVCMLVSIPVS